MKITDKRCEEIKYFEDIENGQVFLDDQGCYWLKIKSIHNFVNAVTLDDGESANWGSDERVYPVEAELIIK